MKQASGTSATGVSALRTVKSSVPKWIVHTKIVGIKAKGTALDNYLKTIANGVSVIVMVMSFVVKGFVHQKDACIMARSTNMEKVSGSNAIVARVC